MHRNVNPPPKSILEQVEEEMVEAQKEQLATGIKGKSTGSKDSRRPKSPGRGKAAATPTGPSGLGSAQGTGTAKDGGKSAGTEGTGTGLPGEAPDKTKFALRLLLK